MLARKTSKNQLTLPEEIFNNFPDVDLFDATIEENRILLTPVSLESIRAKMEKLGLTPVDVEEAVEWARKSGS